MNSITIEYGRKIQFTEDQASEWLNDLIDEAEDIMHQPLRIGDDQSCGLSRFAFVAPEMIRGAITHQLIRDKISNPNEHPTTG